MYLSIDAEGQASLWDRAKDAASVQGEAFVILRLTPDQQHHLEEAQELAALAAQQEREVYCPTCRQRRFDL
jgi:hypothetical protein